MTSQLCAYEARADVPECSNNYIYDYYKLFHFHFTLVLGATSCPICNKPKEKCPFELSFIISLIILLFYFDTR